MHSTVYRRERGLLFWQATKGYCKICCTLFGNVEVSLVIVLILLFLLSLVSCSHLTVAPKPVTAHAIAFDANTQNAGIIDCDTKGCLVTANFVVKYKQMEAEYKKTFADDANIKPVGKNYRMPFDCIEHFTQMKATERGGP